LGLFTQVLPRTDGCQHSARRQGSLSRNHGSELSWKNATTIA
jgi:hypothetical protein